MTIRRRGFQPRSNRRTTDWGLGPASGNQSISASGKTLWNVGTSPAINFTVVRTRGQLIVALLTTDAAGGAIHGASGIYMMTEDAFAVGVTAALDPLTDANSDMWLWHSFWDVMAVTATIADGVNAVGAVQRLEIDSKAMRKDFDPERVMVGVTGVTLVNVTTVRHRADTRQLLMV